LAEAFAFTRKLLQDHLPVVAWFNTSKLKTLNASQFGVLI
jgi:hypothetical protein